MRSLRLAQRLTRWISDLKGGSKIMRENANATDRLRDGLNSPLSLVALVEASNCDLVHHTVHRPFYRSE